MLYQEFEDLTGRKDITGQMYHDAIEPIYMSFNGDKTEFCKYAKKLPVELLPMLAEAYACLGKQEEEIRCLNDKYQREKVASSNAEQALSVTRGELRLLELNVMFKPERTISAMRAEHFLDYEAQKTEAQAFGVL